MSRRAAAWLISASIITLGACSPKEKLADGPKPVSEKWIMANIDTEFEPRDVSADEAQKALETLSLWEVNDEIRWDSREGENGNYVFSNITSDTNDFTIEALTIKGLRMMDEEVSFADYFELEGLTFSDPEENAVFKAKKVTLSVPDADMMVELLQTIQAADEGSENSVMQEMFANDKVNVTLGEGFIDDLTVTADGVDFNLDFVGWAENEETRKLSLLMKNITGSATEEGKAPVKFNLDNISMEGLDLEYYDSAFSNDLTSMNPFDPTVESFLMENLAMEGDGFFLNLPKLASWYTDKKDGVFYGISKMPNLTFGFTDNPQDPEFAEMKANLAKLGYEAMEFSMDSRTLLDETNDMVEVEFGRLSMKDGFDMNFDYKISGLKSMMAQFETLKDKEALENDMQGLGLVMDPEFPAALNALSIHNMGLEFVDQSILERSFNLVAEEQEVSTDLVKQQAKGGVMMMTLGAKGDYQTQLAQSFAQNMQQLIDEGGALKISMSPGESLKIGDIMDGIKEQQTAQILGTEIESPSDPVDMDAILESLNIQIEHSPN